MKCIIENCSREAVSRGLCSACYNTALRAIRRGDVTWDVLVSMGLATDASIDRSSSNPLRDALNAKLAAAPSNLEPAGDGPAREAAGLAEASAPPMPWASCKHSSQEVADAIAERDAAVCRECGDTQGVVAGLCAVCRG